MHPCIWLNILGGALEIVGFLLVAVELFRTQRREIGLPATLRRLQGFLARARARMRRLFGRARTHTASAELRGNYGIAASARGTVRRGRGKTLEDHVAALEKNFAELDMEVEQHRRELDEAIRGVAGDLKDARAELEKDRERREDDDREFLRASVALQWWGIGLFVTGASVTTVANLTTCP